MQSDSELHNWRIDPREYARQEERRGRRHAYESLDAVRTALIVIDMVSFFAEASAYVRGIVPNIRRIAEALRAAGGVVAWVLPANEAPLGRVSREWTSWWRRPRTAPSSPVVHRSRGCWRSAVSTPS